MPDARKSLDVLANEWSACRRCDLGKRRHLVNGSFVFGHGVSGGMLFIGEGPGITEEKEGMPFVGKSGRFLRQMLFRLNMNDYYTTNVVACRSCAEVYDSTGTPILDRQGNVRISDETPTPVQVEACRDRLLEQIYIIDPVLIVTLGASAASALLQKPITILKERGTFKEIEIPGVWKKPVLTEKKQQWVRKVKGQLVAPTEQNTVRYLMMPTIHPSFALRYVKDTREKNVFTLFRKDIQAAVHTYNRYIYELTGQYVEDVDLNDEELEDYAESL